MDPNFQWDIQVAVFFLLLEPFKRGLGPNTYKYIYKVYMVLIIKGRVPPLSQGFVTILGFTNPKLQNSPSLHLPW